MHLDYNNALIQPPDVFLKNKQVHYHKQKITNNNRAKYNLASCAKALIYHHKTSTNEA